MIQINDIDEFNDIYRTLKMPTFCRQIFNAFLLVMFIELKLNFHRSSILVINQN